MIIILQPAHDQLYLNQLFLIEFELIIELDLITDPKI